MEEPAFRYDVYLSACPEDADWAEEWLRPRLEAAGLRVGSESDFDLGVARVVNVERAVTGSRSSLLILTPAWVKSGWAEFESVLTQSRAIDDQAPRTLPLLLEPCQPPLRIAALNYADFTQAQRRETKLQQVITAARGERDIKVVGATLSQFLDNRGRMLQKVQSFWVEGVLESGLQGLAPLELSLFTQPDAIPNVWDTVVQRTQAPEPIPSHTSVSELFDHYEGALLILGDPGGGKTTLLLQLARDLLARAEWNPGYPMPIVFNLSSWSKTRKPLADWLIEELNVKYDVPRKLAEAWVAEDQLIPLLDGIDEVDAVQRAACVDAINAFRKEHGFVRIAVCCRQADYQQLPQQLGLRGAVLVRQLTDEQIDAYLEQGGEPLAGLRKAIHQEATLRELAQVPLTLGIMIGAYRGTSAEELVEQSEAGDQQQRLFGAYMDRMFARRGADPRYSREQTVNWLGWLARGMRQQGQSVFLIEGLQPDWLTGRQRIAYTVLDRVGSGVLVGLAVWLALALTNGAGIGASMSASFGVTAGLLAGAFGGQRPPAAQAQRRSAPAFLSMILGFLVTALGAGLAVGLQEWLRVGLRAALFGFIAASLIFGLMGAVAGRVAGAPGAGPRRVRVVDRMRWLWPKAARAGLVGLGAGLLAGLVVAVIGDPLDGLKYGLVFGIPLGLGGLLFGGLAGGEVETTARPNQGIRQSARNAILGILGGVTIGIATTAVILSLTGGSGIWFGVAIALIAGLAYGGYAVLSHFALRIILWRQGAIPWNYAAFLDYAASRVFLRKVGGGYIFVHRMLLEYFAALPDSQAAAPISASAPQRAAESATIK